jgi:hypothetical protein
MAFINNNEQRKDVVALLFPVKHNGGTKKTMSERTV